jgi:hypothetical protein
MMETKHTPGPWTFVPDPNGVFGIYPNSVGGKFLAMTDTRANAHLIAAAPELLEGLKQCSSYLGEVYVFLSEIEATLEMSPDRFEEVCPTDLA